MIIRVKDSLDPKLVKDRLKLSGPMAGDYPDIYDSGGAKPLDRFFYEGRLTQGQQRLEATNASGIPGGQDKGRNVAAVVHRLFFAAFI
jgi:hypothetical protein